MSNPYIAVVGGCNFDIYATSAHPLISADSNPGHVYTAPGGVGRNIAENLSRLGLATKMLTALGADAFGNAIVHQAEQTGLDLSACLRLPHFSTSVYVCINQNDGDIAVAVSDMGICEQINPSYLQKCSHILDEAALVVADANLTEEALHFLSHHYGSKLCVDCVSGAKAGKLKPILKDLYCVKANRSEAAIISGIPVENACDAAKAAERLHHLGIQVAIITLGEYGAYVSDGTVGCAKPLMPGKTINTSGCGDAFFAGALMALLENQSTEQILRYGLSMARLCAASQSAVSPAVSRDRLLETIQNYKEDV